MRAWMAALGVVLAAAGGLRAEPLEEARVAADAQWIAHVDFDALRASSTFQSLAEPWLATERVRRELAKIRDTLGMDPTKALHGVTFYAAEPKEGRGVAMISAEVDPSQLQAFLAGQPDYATAPYRDHTIHSCSHRRGSHGRVTFHGCAAGPSLLLFGQDLGDLKAALDTLDGRRPNLGAGGSPLGGASRPGTVLDLRAAGLAEADLPLKSPIIRRSERLRIAMGEHDGNAFVEAQLVAKSPENASDIRDVVVGAIAAVRLHFDGNEDALNTVKAIHVDSQGPAVTLSWEGQAADVVRIIGSGILKKVRGGDR